MSFCASSLALNQKPHQILTVCQLKALPVAPASACASAKSRHEIAGLPQLWFVIAAGREEGGGLESSPGCPAAADSGGRPTEQWNPASPISARLLLPPPLLCHIPLVMLLPLAETTPQKHFICDVIFGISQASSCKNASNGRIRKACSASLARALIGCST